MYSSVTKAYPPRELMHTKYMLVHDAFGTGTCLCVPMLRKNIYIHTNALLPQIRFLTGSATHEQHNGS